MLKISAQSEQLLALVVKGLRRAIKNSLDLMPSIEALQMYDLSCNRSVFLEILIIAIKSSSLSHQHDFFKIKNAKKKYLETKIKNLKKDFQNNIAEILRTERELNRVADDEMREEVLRMRNFEYLNNEKITPYFLSLAKKPQHSEDLLNVCDVQYPPKKLRRHKKLRRFFNDFLQHMQKLFETFFLAHSFYHIYITD